MSVNVPQLIVHVKETPETFLSCGHWPITRQDIFVELQVCRSLGKVQKPRPFAEHHHDFILLTAQLPRCVLLRCIISQTRFVALR